MAIQHFRYEDEEEFDIQGEELFSAGLETLGDEILAWAGAYELWHVFELDSFETNPGDILYIYPGVREYMTDYDGCAPGCSGASIIVTADDYDETRTWFRRQIARMLWRKRDWIKAKRRKGEKFFPLTVPMWTNENYLREMNAFRQTLKASKKDKREECYEPKNELPQ